MIHNRGLPHAKDFLNVVVCAVETPHGELVCLWETYLSTRVKTVYLKQDMGFGCGKFSEKSQIV